MNLLVGEEKAIVTDIAGTTRDVLEETITLQGISLRVIDTAGIRSTDDVVEKIGVGRARERAKDADLILYVVDSSVPLDENDEDIIEMIRSEEKKTIVLLNKSDLNIKVTADDINQYLPVPVISISAKEETGLKELEDCMKDMFLWESYPSMMKFISRISGIRRRLRRQKGALNWLNAVSKMVCRRIFSPLIL